MAFVITKPGNPRPEKYYYGRCEKCGCEFECDDRDTLDVIGFKAKVNCPTCKKVVTVTECED